MVAVAPDPAPWLLVVDPQRIFADPTSEWASPFFPSAMGNIRALAAELNLGLDDFVFVDDNPMEIDEVSSAARGGQARLALAGLARLVPEFEHAPNTPAAGRA